jgi:Chlorophyll A-B binding protein
MMKRFSEGVLTTGFHHLCSGEVFWGVEKPAGYTPGNYGFDPLNLYKVRGDKKAMEAAEIKNGRLAMIAITAFVFQEVATGLPVVQETPYLF